MKTQDEIRARMKEREAVDPFGFEMSVYVSYLDFEHAKPFLKEGVTEDEWNEMESPLPPIERMHGYMDFAWDKANNMRGISANRNIQKCLAWLWLAGEDELHERVETEYDTDYRFYGKPILEMICDHFGWDWKQWDDGVRTNG